MNTQKIKPFVLPTAIVLGFALHSYCAAASETTPYVVFVILLLTFCAVDLRRLRFSWLAFWLIVWQVAVSVAGYLALRLMKADPTIAEGVLMAILCPVASSVAVISCMLGANRETVTAFTIYGNIAAAIAAPVIFTAIGVHPELSFGASFIIVLRKIAPTLALPYFVALTLQLWLPKANERLARYKGWAFYLWALLLLCTLGRSIDEIFQHGSGKGYLIASLALVALAVCILQFALGRKLGKAYGDTISGGQLMGQKNTGMGIWMAATFLHPLSSVALAFYSVFQNAFNSWQLWQANKKKEKQLER